ncbi:MAG: DUF459 domain-containing protein [Actinomycetota bacterium]
MTGSTPGSEPTDPLARAVRHRDRGDTWTDEQFRAAREADLTERTRPVRTSVLAVLGCLVLAALLTSGKLVEIAERQEFGDARDRNLAWAEGVDRIANFLSLNRPYDAIQDLRDANNDRVEVVATTTTTTTTTAAPASTTTASASTSSTSTTTTTTVPVGREVDDAEPLRVYLTGDSQATYLGQAVTTEGDGRALQVTVDDRISTSLARPDYFDWPTRWASVMAADDPEVVVVFIGANDHQDMADAAGNRLVEGTDEWQREWKARLAAGLEVLTEDGRPVLWITQPPMRDGELDAGIDLINEMAAEVIDDRPSVAVVDIWELFGGADGYAERVTGPDGETITARVSDGVHVSRPAASWVADLIFAELDGRWSFVS